MYVPPHFREHDAGRVMDFVEATRLATLVSAGPAGLRASHVPMLFERAVQPRQGDAAGVLVCHLARANDQWRDLADGAAVLAIFLGPDAYVSPTLYERHAGGRVVPTWNYVAVHAHGTARIVEEKAALHALVSRLTDAFERDRDDAWAVDEAPDDYVDGQLRGIVGIEIVVERFDAKWKMSQNRSDADRAGVVAGLRASVLETERRTADIMAALPPRDP